MKMFALFNKFIPVLTLNIQFLREAAYCIYRDNKYVANLGITIFPFILYQSIFSINLY